MVKNFKLMVTLTLMIGLAFSAMAAEMAKVTAKVGANARLYIGQYDSGADEQEAYISDYGEYTIYSLVSAGAMSAYGEIEIRNGAPYNPNAINATQQWLQWKGESFALKMGTIVTSEGVPFSYVGQLTTALPADLTAPIFTSGYMEDPGVSVAFTGIKGHTLRGTYFTVNPISGSRTSSRSGGTGSAVGATGKFGSIGYKLQYVTETVDDVNDKEDTALNTTVTDIGLQYSAKSFNVSVDSLTTTREIDVAGSAEAQDQEVVTMAAVKINSLGPGNAKVSYTTYNMPEGNRFSPAERVQTGIGVVYNLLISLPGVIQFIYLNDNTDFASDVNDLGVEDVTATFTGVGMNLKF